MAAHTSPQSGAEPRRSLIPDHMEGWPNDDLLLNDSARVQVESEHKGARRVFVWDDLCTLFRGFDQTASAKRKGRQRSGFIAVLAVGLGSALSAALPLIGPDASNTVFVTAAALSAIGLIWCLALAVRDPEKAAWMVNRLRTERLRQFYFQFMGSDPALAAAAFADDDAYARWEAKRKTAQAKFEAWLSTDMQAELDAVIEDVNHRAAWQMTAWETPPPAPPQSPALEAYFRLMRKQRIGMQRRYVTRKLRHGFGSPLTRHIANQVLSYFFAIATACLSITAAWKVASGAPADGASILQLVSAIALLGVVSMVLKIMAEGHQIKSDVERYAWYRQAIEDVDAQFENPDPAVRIEALRRMEAISYRELRDFLKAHNDARFTF